MEDDLAEMEEGGGFTYKPIGHVKSVFQGMTSIFCVLKNQLHGV